MESYNHMMDADYGNIVYGSGIPNQMHQNLPTEELIMNNPDVSVKDAEYPSRETIIASNLPSGPVDGVYPENTNLDNGEENMNEIVEINQFINSTSEKVVPEDIADTEQQIQPIEEAVPMDSPTLDASTEQSTEPQSDDVLETFAPEAGTTTSLEIEPTTAENVDAVAPVDTGTKKENEVDQNQCRVCLSKDNLVNIFAFENKSRICDIIMTICTTVKIIEKDYLPHYICSECLDKLKIAAEFKSKCETTDTELRKKLKRSKNKVRGSGRFLLIDCEMSSGSEIDDNKDDDEFQISDVVESDPDSDASFKIGKRKSTRVKKKSPPKRKAQSRNRTPSAKSKASSSVSSGSKRTSKSTEKTVLETKRIKHDVVYIEALPELSDDDDEGNDAPKGRARRSNALYNTPKSKSATNQPSSSKTSKIPHKKRAIDMIESDDEDSKTSKGSVKPREHICSTCNKILPSWNALKEHRKTHSGETFACNICNKPFKQRASLDAHIQKHKEDESRTCKPCNKPFASKLELRKHQQSMHEDQFTFECNTCKRTFTAKARLDKHKEGKCPGFDTSTKKKSEVEVSSHLGRDLFKCVAPLTTTYWSDSFSE